MAKQITVQTLRAQLMTGTRQQVPYNLLKRKEAARIYQRAVSRGEIKRKNYCEACGVKSNALVRRKRSYHTRVKICAHHSDYAKPLLVVYLCGVCHHAVHNPGTAFSSTLTSQYLAD